MVKNLSIVLLLTLICLSACGFQLRSDVDLSQVLGVTRLSIVDEFSPFARQLQRSLQRSGVELLDQPGAAASNIDVSVNRVTREILTIGDTARVREYRINHQVAFRVLNASGEEILPLQVLQQTRDLSFDEGALLAATREEEFVREALSRNLVRLVVQRLSMMATP